MIKRINIENRKSRFNYEFLETYTAGICLLGSEVKSIRDHRVSMVDSFCFFVGNELWIKNLNITQSDQNSSHDPIRDRKILLKKRELKRLKNKLDEGLSIIPIRIFTSENNKIKIEISLSKGKKLYDKRESIKNRDIDKEISRNLNMI
jgi:SsrA-binding protein